MQTEKATENIKNEQNEWNTFLRCRRNSRAVIGIQCYHYGKSLVWQILVRRLVMCARHANSCVPKVYRFEQRSRMNEQKDKKVEAYYKEK